MKTFMAVYTGDPAAFEKWQHAHPDPKQRDEMERDGMQAWMKWGETHARSTVDNGSPLGKTKRINKHGISDVRNNLAGYTIVKAESQDAAARMFINHPHFTIFPGDAVEIMECLPMPTVAPA